MPVPLTVRDPAPATLHPAAAGAGAANAPTASPWRRSPTATTAAPLRGTRHLDDISTSPRLFGYIYSLISSAVSTISATMFLLLRTTAVSTDEASLREYFASQHIGISEEALQLLVERIYEISDRFDIYIGSGGEIVQQWKVYGCIAVSGLLTIITGIIVMAHFDHKVCVKNNRITFHDGSKFERNLLLMLIVLAVAALYISTSKFSVGVAQANVSEEVLSGHACSLRRSSRAACFFQVFFSTWTNFVSCAVNYEVWRKGSGRNLSFQNILFGHERRWFLLSIFSSIAFFAALDFFAWHSAMLHNTSDPVGCENFNAKKQGMWISGFCAVVCWSVVLLQKYCTQLLVVWIMEVVVSVSFIFVQGYVVSEFSGGMLEQLPCPSNLYFSVLGSFFLSVWILTSLIQEGWSRKER